MRLLLTRPESPDGDALKTELQARGHAVTSAPLLDVVLTGSLPPLEGVQALIVTSRNGLRGLDAATDAVRNLTVYAVGAATAARATQAGFRNIVAGDGGARELAGLIRARARPEDGALLHLAGEQVAFDLKSALAQHGFEVRPHTVYRTEPAAVLPQAARDGLETAAFDGVVLMSPRTAKVYGGLVAAAGLTGATQGLVHFCLSEAVAQELGALGPVNAVVAQAPNSQEMLALIAREASDSA